MKNIRSKKMLRGAEGQFCVCCRVNDGTITAAHYQGIRGDAFGRGIGIKCHDFLIADLCYSCHKSMDNYEDSPFNNRNMKKLDHSERFLFFIALTLERRFRQGILKTDDVQGI